LIYVIVPVAAMNANGCASTAPRTGHAHPAANTIAALTLHAYAQRPRCGLLLCVNAD